MFQYRISVIVPTYKPGEYLWQCLASLQKQTLGKDLFEVIIVLNGCRDPYESRIKEYLRSWDVHYTFFQLDEGGVSNARNYGIEAASGEFIAFIDDDDYVSESYLEELLEVSSADTIGLCLPIAFMDGSNERRSYSLTDEFMKKSRYGKQRFYCPKKLFAGPCMKLIHRSMIGNRRFDPSLRNSEDSLFMFVISDKVKWAAFTSTDAVYYRRYRKGSAIMRKRAVSERVSCTFQVIWKETVTFWANFPRYSFPFYLTRVLGAIHGLWASLL